jgi:hypothetical protein
MLIAILAGLIVIALSAAMIPTRQIPWLRTIIRDIGMIFLVGIFLPLYYIQRSGSSFAEFGWTLKRWYIFLPINFVLGTLLAFNFEVNQGAHFHFDTLTLLRVVYLLVPGFFEVLFFYSFQRTLFERAFGIVPGIILAALFYSYHHLGFEPHFLRLFFVGVMYATVFRLGNSALLIYPFFWGVGASYDVLILAQTTGSISHPLLRTSYMVPLILVAVWWTRKRIKTETLRPAAAGA